MLLSVIDNSSSINFGVVGFRKSDVEVTHSYEDVDMEVEDER
jgi:hypothetical protein